MDFSHVDGEEELQRASCDRAGVSTRKRQQQQGWFDEDSIQPKDLAVPGVRRHGNLKAVDLERLQPGGAV
jgi:hypothetical protein